MKFTVEINQLRANRLCYGCSEDIKKGTSCARITYRLNNEWENRQTHMDCMTAIIEHEFAIVKGRAERTRGGGKPKLDINDDTRALRMNNQKYLDNDQNVLLAAYATKDGPTIYKAWRKLYTRALILGDESLVGKPINPIHFKEPVKEVIKREDKDMHFLLFPTKTYFADMGVDETTATLPGRVMKLIDKFYPEAEEPSEPGPG